MKFDKYEIYSEAVQSPEADMEFVRDVYKELRGRPAHVLREDFCGAFLNSCTWVKMNRKNVAYGLDLDPEPLDYGKTKYLPKLSKNQQARVQVLEGNVLDSFDSKVDIVSASNFSYFIFKTREQLKNYFVKAREGLNKNGIFIVDCFGGSDAQLANEEKTKHRKFTYFWDQVSFDPVTYFATFHIHFLLKNETKRRTKVFTYDWRLWTIPELQDLMIDAGFSKTHVYWEGTTKKGKGDGKFKRVTHGEECQGWIAYVVGEK